MVFQLIDHDELIIKSRMLLAAKDAMMCQLSIEYGILRQIGLTISRARKVKLAQDTPRDIDRRIHQGIRFCFAIQGICWPYKCVQVKIRNVKKIQEFALFLSGCFSAES